VGVPGQHQVHVDRHGVREVGRMRDHDAVIGARSTAEQPGQPSWIALAAAATREARDSEGAAFGQRHRRVGIGEAADARSGEDVPARRPHVALRREHAEGRVEPDAGDQRAKVGRRLVLRLAAEGVLNVVAGEHDQVGMLGQACAKRPLFVRTDGRGLDVGDVQDPYGVRARVGTGGGLDGVVADLQLGRLDAVGLDVHGDEGKGRRAAQDRPSPPPRVAVDPAQAGAEQDGLAEKGLAEQAERDLADVHPSRIVDVGEKGRGKGGAIGRERSDRGVPQDGSPPTAARESAPRGIPASQHDAHDTQNGRVEEDHRDHEALWRHGRASSARAVPCPPSALAKPVRP
jgi:hypothetical protein